MGLETRPVRFLLLNRAFPEYSSSMPLDLEDTIVALASPPGPALRGIVRVSGVNTADVVARLFRPGVE